MPSGRFAGFKTLFGNYSDKFYEARGANHPDNAVPCRLAFWFSGWPLA